MIFVCVGSRRYQFNRLFIELDRLCEEGIIKEEIFAQIGVSSYKPKYFKYKDFISLEEFQEKMEKADIVITHGGTASIMKALNLGKKVISVTRLKKYGEHIDDHQRQISEAFSSNKYLLAIFEIEDLESAIKEYYNETAQIIPWENKDPMRIIKIIDEFIKENYET